MAKKKPLDLICTAEEAAAILGVTPERVMQFCRDGRLEARKLGRDWAVDLQSLRQFAKEPREGGRPKNS
jgi:excisionase family DNA binding protein